MPTSSSARLTAPISASTGGRSKPSSRARSGPQASSSSSTAKRSSKSNKDDDQASQQLIATAEIVEKATLPLHGLSTRDALTVWKALGLYLGDQLTQRRRVISVDRFGVFGYNDASEAVFLHSSVFLRSNRLKECIATQGLKGQPALATGADPMSKINTTELSQEYLQNCDRDVVEQVVTHVVAHIGKLAKQGRRLRLSFSPLGEWHCTGEHVEFKFLPEFQQQMVKATMLTKTHAEKPGKAKKEIRTPEEMRERGRSAHVEERREPESTLTAQALQDHTLGANSTNQQKMEANSQARSHGSSDRSSKRIGWSEKESLETMPMANSEKTQHGKRPAKGDRSVDVPVGGVMGRVRAKLLERCGERGLNALERVLSLLDTSGDGVLSAQELKFGLRDLGIELSRIELQQVVKFLDRNGDGVVSLDELLHSLRGTLSEARRQLIEKAYDCMDRKHCGVVTMDDLRENYDVSLLPRVRAGKKTKIQAMNEFLREWEISVEHNNGIPREAFIEYYHNISAGIPDDSDFELLMRQTWHVNLPESESESDDEGPSTEHGVPRTPISRQQEDSIQNPIEPAIASQADEWKYLRSVLLPSRPGGHTQPSLDDVCRRLGVNRVWGDGNETMNTRAFANALGRLDRQLPSKDAQHLAQIVAQCCDSCGCDMISLATLVPLLMAPSFVGATATAKSTASGVGIIDRVRARLLQRLQTQTQDRGETTVPTFLGLNALQRTLRLLDSNGDKRLSKDELKIGLRKIGVEINFHELDQLFTCLDADRNGCIDMDEFLVAMRGGDEALTKNPRRLALVHQAFDLLDRDCDGSVTLQELSRAYDTSKHPEVLAGRMTREDALRQFATQWDTLDKDGIITRREFEVYYHNVSAVIDRDDYFELMMRNAWHISGGVGQSANTSNRRVLVTNADGSQRVCEVKNDLGIRATDRDKIHAKLRAQGVEASDFSTSGYVEEDKQTDKNLSMRPSWPRERRENQPQSKLHVKEKEPVKQAWGRGKKTEAANLGPQGDISPSNFLSGVAGTADQVDSAQHRRQEQRQLRERAALLIQSHFRGFKSRKFAECVRRRMAAEHLRKQREELEQAPRKWVVTRAALKSYYGF